MQGRPLSRMLIAASVCAVLGAPTLAQTDAASRQLYAANGLANRGLCDLAITEYRAFLDAAPEHQLATLGRYGLAACLARSGEYTEAVELLDQVVEDRRFEFLPDALLLHAQSLLAMNEYARADEQAEAFLRRFADHARAGEASALRAEALYREGEYNASSSIGREAVQEGGAWAWRAGLFAGLADAARGRDREAVDVLEASLGGAPSDDDRGYITLLIAQAEHRLGDEAAALSAYERVIEFEIPTSFAPALQGAAQIRLARGEFDAAAEIARTLRGQGGTWAAWADVALGRAALGEDDLAEARKRLGPLLADGAPEVTRDSAAYWLAKVEAASGDHGAAFALLDGALERSPENALEAEMRYDAAIALANAGRSEDAIRALAVFIRDHEEHALTPAAAFAEARLLHDAGEYEMALERAEAWLGAYAGHDQETEAEFLRAESLYLLGRLDDASDAYESWLTAHDDHRDAELATLRYGLCRYELGDDEGARAALEPVAPLASDSPIYRAAWLALGEIAFADEQWETAATRLLGYAAFDSGVASRDAALLKAGLALERLDRLAPAADAFRSVLNEHPDSDEAGGAAVALARVLEASGDGQGAERTLRTLVEERPSDGLAPASMRRLGQMAHAAGRMDEAIAWYERAIAGGETEAASGARLDLVRALLAAKNNERALRELGLLPDELSDGHRATAGALGVVTLSRLGRNEEAIQSADRALTDDRRALLDRSLDRLARFERARAMLAVERTDDAAAVLTRLLAEQDRDEVRLYAATELASLASASESHERAQEFAQLVLRDERAPAPARERALYVSGVSSWRTGDHAAAADTLETLLGQFGDSELAPPAALVRGEALLELGQRDAALEPLTLAASGGDDSTAPAALLRLGETLSDLQRWARAEEVFAEHLTRFGDDARAYQARFGAGWAKEHQERYDDAIADYRMVVDTAGGPTAARAQFQIGECFFAQEKLEDAARELLRVDLLYAYPEWSAAALCEAGRCFEQLARPRDARAQYDRVIAEYPDSDWAVIARERVAQLTTATPPGRSRGANTGGGN